MKTNSRQLNAAILHTFFRLYNAKDLVKEMSTHIKDGDGIEVQEAKNTSFSLRCRKDADITDERIVKLIRKSIDALLDEKLDEVSDILSDEYDLVYNPDKMITDELVTSFFDFGRSGRIIYVDIDE